MTPRGGWVLSPYAVESVIAGTIPSAGGLVYLCGPGRSGSTFLERLFAVRYQGIAVGEVPSLIAYAYKPNWICSCGRQVPECEFWGRVIAECDWFGDRAEVDRVRSTLRRGLGLRSMWRHRHSWANRSPAAPWFLERVGSLYRAIASVAAPRKVFDSSKSPWFGRVVEAAYSDAFLVIGVIRDPIDVAASLSREKKTRDENGEVRLMAQYGAIKAAVFWRTMVRLTELWLVDRPNSPGFVRYEDMRALSNIPLPVDRHGVGGSLHQVGGNPNRFAGSVDWQSEVAGGGSKVASEIIVRTMTMGVRGRYGY